ncbi:hypothetical protein Cylst_5618 [Cylindrospermum stagnale PCC 7417]|uniref:Uncharacterized protein n=1 Tax=Cylindrospermum stagnale PCC 7417 TaxID=56107 RepID=K9X6A4_9NOST|nr:CTB family bacteriocin [Cylindrospermum stagnale]AFZ27619.1 hypothetical protein Cylst_5618 [Cylindrospermum stagnale PCC 7417]
MSNLIISSELFVVLSDEQQELLAGGADFELSNSNFANRLANLQGATASGPGGSTGNSSAINNATNTAAQDFLGLGGTIPTGIGALAPAPELGVGVGAAAPEAAGGGGAPTGIVVNPAGT